jgi:hypothetical protein
MNDIEALEAWRTAQEAALRAPESWLSLIGLFWLKDGPNRVGSAFDSEVLLAADVAPPFVGEICLRDGEVRVGMARDLLLLNGEAADDRPLRADVDAHPDRITVGRLVLQLIRRNERFGIRVRDPESPSRTQFVGRRWYPFDARYRISARFVAHPQPQVLSFDTVIGEPMSQSSPGFVEFDLDGQRHRLTATNEGEHLKFVFRDRSSGSSTYAAGRFLSAPAPAAGLVELDFNRAYNPPCAFTAFATCPLPPRENHLEVAIEAGERWSEGEDRSIRPA